jgi:hypothetical protein
LAQLSNSRGLIEATVLSSSLLKTPQATTNNSYSTTVLIGKQRVTLTLDQPLAKGSSLLLQADAKAVRILNISAPLQIGLKEIDSTTPMIQQALREVLPQQQPIKYLLPLLINTLQHAKQLPLAISQQALQLLASFPSAEKLSSLTGLKHSMQSSGVMLESQLQAAIKQATTDSASPQIATAYTRSLLSNDSKALSQQLLAIVTRYQQQSAVQSKSPPQPTAGPAAASNVTATNSHRPMVGAAAINNSVTTVAIPILPGTSTTSQQPENNGATHNTRGQYQGQYLPYQLPITTPQGTQATKPDSQESLDILLRQLSQQLLASLARTQSQQLETLSNRQNLNSDNNTGPQQWTFELPIINGRHIDNLQLLIEKQLNRSQQQHEKNRWTVMLNFDLHQLGTLNVELNIIGKSVSAKLWAAQQDTLNKVKGELDSLKQSLERAGVTVKTLECEVGSPTNTSQFKRQLVDTHS